MAVLADHEPAGDSLNLSDGTLARRQHGLQVAYLVPSLVCSDQALQLQDIWLDSLPEFVAFSLLPSDQEPSGRALHEYSRLSHPESIAHDLTREVAANTSLKVDQPLLAVPQLLHRVSEAYP